MNTNEDKNSIKRVNACSISKFQWFNENKVSKSLGMADLEFNSSKGTNYVKFICLKAYGTGSINYKYAIELVDNQYNKYFLFIGQGKGDDTKPLSINASNQTNVFIPIFEIQEENIFFHVGDDGIKTVKKNVYQDIDSYLELNNFQNSNQAESDKIQNKFNFVLARVNMSNYEEIFKGTCCNPTLEQVKKSIVKQFVQSYCFEKLIFSCHQEKKSSLQIFTKFFVIIDQNFITDTFNYWQDKSKDIGIETDYKALVKRNGIPFDAAQQFLMDSECTVESFIQASLEDQESADDVTSRSNLYLNPNRYLTEDQEKLMFSVFCLYGLLHAKYILTPPGQAKMLELYIYNSFPKCPRSKCNGIRCLPYGITEKPGQNAKIFCPKCETIYNYTKNKLDGAFFGPTYVHLLIKKFPKLKEFEKNENDKDQNENENNFSMFGIPLISKEDEKAMTKPDLIEFA